MNHGGKNPRKGFSTPIDHRDRWPRVPMMMESGGRSSTGRQGYLSFWRVFLTSKQGLPQSPVMTNYNKEISAPYGIIYRGHFNGVDTVLHFLHA